MSVPCGWGVLLVFRALLGSAILSFSEFNLMFSESPFSKWKIKMYPC